MRGLSPGVSLPGDNLQFYRFAKCTTALKSFPLLRAVKQ